MKLSSPFYTLLLMSILLISCSTKKSIDTKTHDIAIRKVLSAQQEAWNKGNIDAFMKGYWNDEAMTFVGSRGVNYGWKTTLDNYKKSYPDSDTMGKLHFDVIELRPLSYDSYYMLGQYTLTRKEDKPTGYFSLIWQNINGQWVITSDHTSG